MTTINVRIEAALSQAYKGCGQSDVLFSARLRGSLAGLLRDAAPQDRPAVELAISEHCPATCEQALEPADDECRLTGISTYCCPCGWHL